MDLGLLALALITLIVGLVIHSFIIVVNVNDWLKGRSMTPVDHIVTFLEISRMCSQGSFTLFHFVSSLFVHTIMSTVYSFSFYANFWLTSLLSIVLCLKISSLHTRLFLYLRRMIEQRTAYCIVASGLLSAINCLLTKLRNLVTKDRTDTTMQNLKLNCTNFNFMYNFTLGVFIPFLFFFISSVLLFSSLYHHTRRMKMSGNLSINLETYYSTMRFVSFTFICNTIYIIGQFFGGLFFAFYCLQLSWLITVLECLPALHSSYLIYRTAKLRSQMSKVFLNVMDFLFQRKDL